MTDPWIERLEQAWEPARAAGALGSASVEDLVAHTAGYVSAVCAVLGCSAGEVGGVGVDVGSGAGIPGVLLALQLPATEWRLVDGNERRCDFARRAARAAGVADRVTVHHGRAEDIGHDPTWREQHDLGVSRLLAAPSDTAELVVPLVREDGIVVCSADAEGVKWWQGVALGVVGARLEGVFDTESGLFVALRRRGAVDARLPRRPRVRRRKPLL